MAHLPEQIQRCCTVLRENLERGKSYAQRHPDPENATAVFESSLNCVHRLTVYLAFLKEECEELQETLELEEA